MVEEKDVKKNMMLPALALVAVTIVAGCRAEEQNRVVRFEPGVYKGKADQEVAPEVAATLRDRAILQGGTFGSSGGAEPYRSSTSDVRAPTDAAQRFKDLNERTKLQGGHKLP